MNRYLLDTNILLLYLRQDKRWFTIQNQFDLNSFTNVISVVSLGELRSIALRNHWGEKRMADLYEIQKNILVADINIESIIQRYAEIDAYSQGKLVNMPLNNSARNMTKNDLWIAATASILNLTLITTDLDFNHLSNTFLKLETLDIQLL